MYCALWSQPEPTTYLLPVWYKYMSEAHLVLAGTCTAKVSTDTSQYFYSRFHLHEDVWASRLLIHYLASRLLVSELILHLESQSDTSIEQILLTAHASRTIIQMAVRICVVTASQYLFPDYMSLDGYTSFNRNGAMLPLSGVLMFIYPLAVTATTSGVSDDLREWVLHTLDHIGQTIGIREALLMKAEVAQSSHRGLQSQIYCHPMETSSRCMLKLNNTRCTRTESALLHLYKR